MHNEIAARFTEEHLKALEASLKSHTYKITIQQNITGFQNYIEELSKDQSLDRDETWAEILEIQAYMKKNNRDYFVGYLHTGSAALRKNHFESFLISQNAIIKSPWWSKDLDYSVYINAFEEPFMGQIYSADPRGFFLPGTSLANFNGPQSDYFSCGSLCLSNLTELLKEEQQQLALTLRFTFYGSDNNKYHYFLASPGSFLKSHSTSYINYINGMVMENKSTISIKDGVNVKTIEQALKDSINIATKLNDSQVVQENTNLLKELPQFREKWKPAFKSMLQNRAQLKLPEGYNLSLLYRTLKNQKLARNVETKKKVVPTYSVKFSQTFQGNIKH
jgi:hypothetical protein